MRAWLASLDDGELEEWIALTLLEPCGPDGDPADPPAEPTRWVSADVAAAQMAQALGF